MRLRVFGLRSWIFFAVAGVLWCQDPADPPARVARLGSMNGSVSLRPGNEEWAPATLNYPLTTGDRLWTDTDSHADLHVGTTAVHMAPETAFAVLYLDDRTTQLSVSQGAINLRIPRMDDDEVYEVDTPAAAITLLRVGDYRIDVTPDGNVTMLTVRSGEAEAAAGGQRFPVAAGQMLRLFAGEQVSAEFLPAPKPDPWDEWCMSEDLLAERSIQASEPYVPAEMTGVEDLSMYGDWSVDSDYGAIWTPRDMGVDWAPYRYGCWVYRAPWGWTWIDDARWGFAPFHYGRWVLLGSTWVWVPGPRIVRPVWAPALVVFVKNPGTGHVGWIPLGPHEPFRPPYRASGTYLRRVNPGASSAEAPASYMNRRHVTAVSREIFAGGRQVAPARIRQADAGLAGARPANSPDVQPGRDSYVARRGGQPNRVVRPPERLAERPVVVRRDLPATVTPVAPVIGADSRPRSVRPESRPAESRPLESRPPDSQRRQDEVQRAVDARRREEERRAEEARQSDEARRADEQRRAESARRQEQQRQAESQRRQEQQRQAESQRRQEEQQRQAESQRRQEEQQRQAESQRRQEEQQRQAESQRRQEQQRQAESQRRQEEQQRQAESQRRQEEQQRQAESQRRQEEQQRQAESQRRQEEQRKQDDASRDSPRKKQ